MLRILTCFLQGGNPCVSDGRDYVHLASCWYYDMDVHMKLAWLSVLCHRPYPQLCNQLQSHFTDRPVSTSFLKSLILQSFLLLVALTHVSKQIFHYSLCSPLAALCS